MINTQNTSVTDENRLD